MEIPRLPCPVLFSSFYVICGKDEALDFAQIESVKSICHSKEDLGAARSASHISSLIQSHACPSLEVNYIDPNRVPRSFEDFNRNSSERANVISADLPKERRHLLDPELEFSSLIKNIDKVDSRETEFAGWEKIGSWICLCTSGILISSLFVLLFLF